MNKLYLIVLGALVVVATSTPAVDIHFLLDRSGSMSSLSSDVIGGFNSYIASQQSNLTKTKENNTEINFSLIQFDSQEDHLVTIDSQRINNVKPLGKDDFIPRGGTPLFDSIGKVIARAELQAAESTATVVVIFTDGEENSSREHTSSSIGKLITAKKEQGWVFLFMGANQDAFVQSHRVGINRKSTQNFAADKQGVEKAFDSLSGSLKNYVRRVFRAKSFQNIDKKRYKEEMENASEDIFDGFEAAQEDYESRKTHNQQL